MTTQQLQDLIKSGIYSKAELRHWMDPAWTATPPPAKTPYWRRFERSEQMRPAQNQGNHRIKRTRISDPKQWAD